MPVLLHEAVRTIFLRKRPVKTDCPYPSLHGKHHGQGWAPQAADVLRTGSFRRESHKRHGSSYQQHGFQRYLRYRYHACRLMHSAYGWYRKPSFPFRWHSLVHRLQMSLLHIRLHQVPFQVWCRVQADVRNLARLQDLPVQDLHGWCARCYGHGCKSYLQRTEDGYHAAGSIRSRLHGTVISICHFSMEQWSSGQEQVLWYQAQNGSGRFLFQLHRGRSLRHFPYVRLQQASLQ